MRVISGCLKGRKIKGYKLNGIRPTMDKIKESVFAIIQNEINNTICLDLFAGTGSLGIEAISNGAKKVYFVDDNNDAIKVIKNNIKEFNIEDKTIVIKNNYQQALSYFVKDKIKFNIIFLDPPYQKYIIDDILEYIKQNNLLFNNGQVICEFKNDKLKNKYGNLINIKEKQYKDKKVIIYKKII